ncbi:4775_t:CDS:2, partial [Dentiscutata erythropus]
QNRVETIQLSNLSEGKAKNTLDHLGLIPMNVSTQTTHFKPIECDPFLWDMETDEDRQMIFIQKKNELELQNANVILKGGADILLKQAVTPVFGLKLRKGRRILKLVNYWRLNYDG